MTSHTLLNLARRHGAPDCLIRRLEDQVIADTLQALQGPPPPSRWPWLLLALAAGVIAGATLIPHAEQVQQIADGGE